MLLLIDGLGSGYEFDMVATVGRLDIDRSSVTVSMTVLIDDSIGVLSIVTNNVRISSVSSIAINNHGIAMSTISLDDGGTTMVSAVMPVSVDNHSLAMPMPTSPAGLDNGRIVPVSVVGDDRGGVSVPSGSKERLDCAEERRGLGFGFTLVDVDNRSVSVASVTIHNDDSIIVLLVSSGVEISINDCHLWYVSE